ncbi:glycerate kinase type-2 family protein [Fuscibacter oryzae]|uniref:Glycerate kinase n=1 Tax=Fuscibacter oryzae TaxID=2803939 RepID=A0A8J7MWS8_9RHOB|nr:glycerate kinase [Fuscibacter oryzae]MBL4930173.1 glycerate kinase [Fuscibacter oryzae]
MVPADPKAFLADLFHEAVCAADPLHSLRPYLPTPPKGRTVVIGAGKGAAQLAQAFETLWPHPLQGTVVTRHGHAAPCKRIEVLEAGHPVPDAAGLAAARRLMERVSGLGPDDLVVALICGGGSALLPAPPTGFVLEDEIALNQALLASGAPISVMNALRRQFSQIKGGRLAALAHPARVVSLVVSDVPGDNPAEVASGPTIPAAGTGAEALAQADLWRIDLPQAIRRHIAQSQTPYPSDPAFLHNTVHVIASSSHSLKAAADLARRQGVPAVILSDEIEGEAREAGAFHAALARQVQRHDQPFAKPVVILSGGETSVTLRGAGSGGRNTEFLLAFAGRIAGHPGIHALAADTDGIDGASDSAGAFADASTVARLLAHGQKWDSLLARNDSRTAFALLDDLFITGPTGTNVNDFRAILVA